MTLVLSIAVILSCAYFLNVCLGVAADTKQRKKMQEVEKQLEQAGISPSGATLTHGMFIDKNSGEIVEDQQASNAWYKRLLN